MTYFYRWILRRYKRHLEAQIDLKRFDQTLSRKLDAVLVLLDE